MIKNFIAIFVFFVTFAANAQTIEFIVSASAGGPNDTVTRKIADKLEHTLNKQIIVLNKPGAAHTIAYNYALSTNKPTLIMATSEVVNHPVYTHLDEVFLAGYFTNIMFVSRKSSITNIDQVIELSKSREILFGHGGIATFSHMAMQTICEKKLRCLPVAYRSAAEGMLGVMSGHIDAYAIVSYGSKQFSENDKITAMYEIDVSPDKSWFKLFSRNISLSDRESIKKVLQSQDSKFYSDMGFKK